MTFRTQNENCKLDDHRNYTRNGSKFQKVTDFTKFTKLKKLNCLREAKIEMETETKILRILSTLKACSKY